MLYNLVNTHQPIKIKAVPNTPSKTSNKNPINASTPVIVEQNPPAILVPLIKTISTPLSMVLKSSVHTHQINHIY